MFGDGEINPQPTTLIENFSQKYEFLSFFSYIYHIVTLICSLWWKIVCIYINSSQTKVILYSENVEIFLLYSHNNSGQWIWASTMNSIHSHEPFIVGSLFKKQKIFTSFLPFLLISKWLSRRTNPKRWTWSFLMLTFRLMRTKI